MRYSGLEQITVYRNGVQTKALEIREIKENYTVNDIYIHIVQHDGETLMNLANGYYGDFKLWYVIADKNPAITNPFNIKARTKVIIPIRL